jgi:hypothetical protein
MLLSFYARDGRKYALPVHLLYLIKPFGIASSDAATATPQGINAYDRM